MTPLSRTERSQLCDLALRVGPDAPTLSGDWTVKDLVVHLLVREGGPASIGITVSPLAFLTERASEKLARHDLDELVARLRSGPPRWSPLGVRRLEEMANSVEYFVHHEDIRRAQPEWEPRTLGTAEEELLWRMVKLLGRGLQRSAGNPAHVDSPPTLWGVPVIITTLIAAGTAIVANFRDSTRVYLRQGPTYETNNAGEAAWKANKTLIRAEERLALAVTRPAGIVKVTALV